VKGERMTVNAAENTIKLCEIMHLSHSAIPMKESNLTSGRSEGALDLSWRDSIHRPAGRIDGGAGDA
jgi:hypothetical protein